MNTQPSGTGFSFDRYYQTMAFQSQQPGFGSTGMSQPSFIQTSPSAAFGFQPSLPPPPWATELLDDMKIVKTTKLQTIEKIEKKTVNSINAKVSDLEEK